MQHTANAQNGRVGHHAQQDDADELHLLDIVGGAGDEGGGGKILNLCVGKVDDAGEGLPAQVTTDGSGHPGGKEAHGHSHDHHQQSKGKHLAAHPEEVLHLHIPCNALCLVFQLHQQQGLAFQAFQQGAVHLAHGSVQLLLQHTAVKAGHLAHGGKLAANGVQIRCRGGNGLGVGVRSGRGHLGKAGHAHAVLPGGGVGGLCGSHIQHDVRGGHGIFQCGALVLGQVGAQLQHAIVLQIVLVGVLQLLRILLVHQQAQRVQRTLAHRLGQGAFNAALLDAGVHDLAGVVRQCKVAVRLHEQQREHHKADRPVPGQLLKDLCHGSFLPSGQCCARHFPQEWHPSARRAARPSGLPAPALTVLARWQSSRAEPAHTGGTAHTLWG